MTQVPLLSALVALPLLGALGVALLPRAAGWAWALLATLATLGVALVVLARFAPGAAGMQLVERAPWLPALGIEYAVGVDGISVFLLVLTALLSVVAVGASWQQARHGERPRHYLVLLLVLSAGMQGVFLATNLFLFYVFWEVMLIPAYLLVGMYGGAQRATAAITFVLYTAAGSLLMLVAFLALGAVVSANSGVPYTLDLPTLLRAGVPTGAQVPLFLGFMAAFAVKAGLFPLHGWVARTYSEAPPAVVVLIAGVMAKTATYGMLRFALPLFPSAARALAPAIGILAVAGVLYFAVQALVARDMYRLLAYVSISHMGVIILGIFAFNMQGVSGAVLQMVNHGILIAALFLIAGAIEARTGTRALADFGALATRLPRLATVFLLVALATLGLPGLNSFAGEFLAFLGAFQANTVLGTLATLVVVPAAWYMLRFFQGVMAGPPPEAGPVAVALATTAGRGRRAARERALADLRWGELGVLLPLLALIVFLGVAPGTVTAPIEQSVRGVVGAVAQAPAHGGASAVCVVACP